MSATLVVYFSLFAVTAMAADGKPTWCVSNKTACEMAGLNITCAVKKGSSCVADVVSGDADLTLASADAMVNNAENLSIVLAESYTGTTKFVRYFGIAVVKKNTPFKFSELRGKKSCHTGAGKTAGWKIPVGYLLRKKKMPFVENQYKSASKYFGDSCAPTIKQKTDDKVVQDDLCKLCNGTENKECSSNDPFADYIGAFRCMASGNSDRVAFVKHTTPSDAVKADQKFFKSVDQYELLCKDDSKKATTEYKDCYIDKRPSSAIVTKKNSKNVDTYRKMIEAANLTTLESSQMISGSVESLEQPKDVNTKEFLGGYYYDYKALSGIGVSGGNDSTPGGNDSTPGGNDSTPGGKDDPPGGKAFSLAIFPVLQVLGIFASLFVL